MKRRDSYCKLLAVSCLGIVLAMPENTAAQNPSYTIAEYNAFEAQAAGKNPQVRIKLLNDFSAKYPNTTLMPYVYENYSYLYFSLQNYPQAVAYVDRLLALGDKVTPAERLSALVIRAWAYGVDCNNSAFQTSEASTKAMDTAAQGRQLLPDDETAAAKTDREEIFKAAARIAATHLKGDPAVCVPPPATPQTLAGMRASHLARYEHLIQELRDEQR